MIGRRDAQGNWSVIAGWGSALGQVSFSNGVGDLAVDAAGNLFVADLPGNDYRNSRIQKRDAQGNWSVIATRGDALGQVYAPRGLAVDAAGNLYVADWGNGRIQQRDAQGNWSLIATPGPALGQVQYPSDLAVDTAGNLYVADGDTNSYRIRKRDAQGNWSVLATTGTALGQVSFYNRVVAQ